MARTRAANKCNNCGDYGKSTYYKDPRGIEGRVCISCWGVWRRNGTFERKRSRKSPGKCRDCGTTLYRATKWGLICSACRRGDEVIKSNNGTVIKNPSYMTYEERETCRRLSVKWKRGILNGVDVYSIANIYLDYHFKNEEMDTLKINKQIDKMMDWMSKLFEIKDI